MRILTTEKLMKEGLLPEWIGAHIATHCQCGSPILNTENMKSRWCANPWCPYHMQHKGDEMFKHLGVKGIGPATCLSAIKQFKLTNHFDLMPILLEGKPPRVHLWEVGHMAAIQGLGPVFWEKELAGYKSFEDYFANAGVIHPLVRANKELLIKGQTFFNIKMPLSKNYITVMLNGSITGFNNRSQFINKCNDIAGQHIRIVQSKSQSADYCITENPASQDSKVVMARKHGIPIVSPKKFIEELTERVLELLNR